MKILLVDDSKSARYALRLQLQHYGVEVETAESAEAAFEVLKGDLPDAILMDQLMPGLNGFEALERIHSEPRTAQLPVVICTAHEDPAFAVAARGKGVAGILPKSVAQEKLPGLLAELRAAIGRHCQPAAQRTVGPVPPGAVPPIPPQPAAQAHLEQLMGQGLEALVDERIEARLAALIEPMVRDLKQDLLERLLAESRQLMASQRPALGPAAENWSDAQPTAPRAGPLTTGLDPAGPELPPSQTWLYLGLAGAVLTGVLGATTLYLVMR